MDVFQSADLLYAGTRRGAIYCYKSQKRVECFQQKSSVYALFATSDDRQLIAADFSGGVKLILFFYSLTSVICVCMLSQDELSVCKSIFWELGF